MMRRMAGPTSGNGAELSSNLALVVVGLLLIAAGILRVPVQVVSPNVQLPAPTTGAPSRVHHGRSGRPHGRARESNAIRLRRSCHSRLVDQPSPAHATVARGWIAPRPQPDLPRGQRGAGGRLA